MKIDSFCHLLPPAYAKRFFAIDDSAAIVNLQTRTREVPALTDMDLRFQQMDEFGDYRQIINVASPPMEDLGPAARNAEMARIANEGMAELVEDHPDRFAGFCAAVSLDDVDRAIEEAEYAFTHLNAVGVQIYCHVKRGPMDDKRYDPFWEKLAGSGKMIQVHPNRNSTWADYPTEERSKFEIWWALGWEYDLSAFMARMVFSGVIERWPDLKFLVHHGGAMIPHFPGRIGAGWDQLGSRTPESQKGDVEGYPLTKRPFDYFKNFYVDTACFGAGDALRTSVRFFGHDRVLFASDSPFDPEKGPGFIRATIQNVEELDLSSAQRQAIYHDNAVRLFGLTAP
ncbi:amidohydrolase family protein [Streptomyces canus]|uniref:amidohydrolase family protein n=1 Tax=Streptomyces canus TaxID=58343 RepID=UPI0036E6F997